MTEEKLAAEKKHFLQKTKDLDWGDWQPYELAKQDWLGSTGDRYAKKR
jgi:hypothetical protein